MADEVTQDGSVEHPWLASNYAELVDYLENKTGTDGEKHCWIKLTSDINCNEACPDGWSTVTVSNNLDMDGHKIIAPIVKKDNKLFYSKNTKSEKLTIKNGHILNVYENFVGSDYEFFGFYSFTGYYINLLSVQLDLHLRNLNVSLGRLSSIKNCRISINGKFSPNYEFFNGDTEIDSNIFELNYKSSDVSKKLFESYYTKKQINNCLFIGEVDNFNLCSACVQGASGTANSGSFVNCVIAVKTSNTTNYRYCAYGNNLISSDTKGMTFADGYGTIETLTDAQLKSLTAVQGTSFTVAPVTS